MLHLIKLVVGAPSLEDCRDRLSVLPVQTRFFPKRAEELLEGGSLFRVIGGLICCRQIIRDIRTITREDGTSGTEIVVDPVIVPVELTAMRPFQGWRYLEPKAAPPDITTTLPTNVPVALRLKLQEYGLI